MTLPLVAAMIGVPIGSARSTPLWIELKPRTHCQVPSGCCQPPLPPGLLTKPQLPGSPTSKEIFAPVVLPLELVVPATCCTGGFQLICSSVPPGRTTFVLLGSLVSGVSPNRSLYSESMTVYGST